MKLLNISILFLQFFSVVVKAQPDIDSLEHVINEKQGSEKVNTINQVAKMYIDRDLTIAQHLSEESFQLSENINDMKGKAVAASLLGLINYLQGHFNQAEYYCKIGKGIAYTLQDIKSEREINTTLALVYEEEGKYKESLELFKRNFIIDKEYEDSINLAIDYQNIAVICEKSDKPDSALSYYLRSAGLFEKHGNSERLVKVYSYIGNLYISNDLDSARYYLNNSFNLYNRMEGIPDFYDLFWDLSEYLLKRNRPDSSAKILEIARLKAETGTNMNMLMKAYKLLSATYEKSGQFADAYRYQKKFTNLKDSLDSEILQSKVNDHVQKLENENKEQALELMRKEAQIRDKQWLNEDIIYFITFGGVFLVLFVFIAFFARYRLYKKSIAAADKLKQDLGSVSTEMIKKDEEISDLQKHIEILSRKNRILAAVINRPVSKDTGMDSVLDELKNILNEIDGHRAGILVYNEFLQFVPLGEYDIRIKEKIKGLTLSPKSYPVFIEAIRSNPYLASEDCKKDPVYQEFPDGRFNNNCKTSRIDYPIKIEQKLLGLLFAEKDDPEPGWLEKIPEIISERSDKFIPSLIKAFHDKSQEVDIKKPDMISIKTVFKNFKILLLEKNEEGRIYQSFPENIVIPGIVFDGLKGKNWMEFIENSDRENVEEFYRTVSDNLKGNPFLNYGISDLQGKTLSVKEEVNGVIYINAERRLKSLLFLNINAEAGPVANDVNTGIDLHFEETPDEEISSDQKDEELQGRFIDFNYLKHNKWFIIYLLRFYKQLAINIGEELPLFRLNDLETRIFSNFESLDLSLINSELQNIVAILVPEFSPDIPAEQKETIEAIFKQNTTGLYRVEYAIDFLVDKLSPLGEKKLIFHKEWQYNKPFKCDLSLMIFIIYQVIINGMESIKREGDIYIRTGERNNKLNIVITDTGEGIPQEVRKNLFSTAASLKPDKKGYGLYFCKIILDSVGGTIKIRSQLSKGTELLMEIPFGVE